MPKHRFWPSIHVLAALLVMQLPVSTAAAQSLLHTPEFLDSLTSPDVLKLSGQLRERATYLSAIVYDGDDETRGWFWTQRARVDANVNAADWLRGKVSLQSALQQGGDISPIERNDLDIQEAFIDFGPKQSFVRIGRQELLLGSQRLVGTREGTNVRRTWDGVRGSVLWGDWQLDALALREVAVRVDGVFNDGRNEGRDLAGLYTTGPFAVGNIDIYYLWADFAGRQTIEGSGDESRHSVGARWFGEAGGLFWNWEAIYQFGSLDNVDINAWTFAANTGYRWADVPWSPEVMLSTNIASGDHETGDGTLGTFNALYPRGSYFSENALLGPANFFNVHPYLRVRPREDVLAFVDVNFFWRLQTTDGVYGPAGNLIRLPSGSDSRFVDMSVSAGAEWEATKTMFLSVLFTHSAPQAFIEQTGSADNVNFLEFTLKFIF
ncbi:MAG: alginate export family protein [Pseudomonadota bacterium]